MDADDERPAGVRAQDDVRNEFTLSPQTNHLRAMSAKPPPLKLVPMKPLLHPVEKNDTSGRPQLSTPGTPGFRLSRSQSSLARLGGDVPEQRRGLSLLGFLRAELARGYLRESDEALYDAKRDRVYMFMQIPKALEKTIVFGLFLCLDTFLFVFTFLPIRTIIACFRLLFSILMLKSESRLSAVQKCDILRCGIIMIVCYVLSLVDASRLYHFIRGQSVLKLYVIYNVTEIFDKLCASFGQDVLDALFWTASEPRGRRRIHLGIIPHFVLSVLYVLLHSMIVFYQVLTLNVAVNSEQSALLTLLVSNQFMELKSNVFKKFEAHNLFQVACHDIVERFQIVLFLAIISLRNLSELSWDMGYFFDKLVWDLAMVYLSECALDWIKHAFITKFNQIPADVYTKFSTILSRDLASSRQQRAFMDHSHLVARRIGFVPMPLACLVYRTFSHTIPFPRGFDGVLVVVTLYLT
eukprot:Opistho-2@66620